MKSNTVCNHKESHYFVIKILTDSGVFFTSPPVNKIRCHVCTVAEAEFDQCINFPYKAGMSLKKSLPPAKLLWQTKTWSNFEGATE